MKLLAGRQEEQTFILVQDMPDSLVDGFLEQRKKLSKEFKTNAPPGNNFRGYTMVGSNILPKLLVQRYLLDIDRMVIEYQGRFNTLIPAVPGVWIKTQTMFNFQHYEPGTHYSTWHAETTGPEHDKHLRALVFMTYLNDVKEGGETEFLHYQIKIKPKKGLTLLWPAGFTHTHRGCPAPHEEKMIITGWCTYSPRILLEPFKP